MAKPASYTIIETVRGDGSSFFRVQVGRWRWLSRHVNDSCAFETVFKIFGVHIAATFTSRDWAEAAAKSHWKQHLRNDTSLVLHREHDFDPEGQL